MPTNVKLFFSYLFLIIYYYFLSSFAILFCHLPSISCSHHILLLPNIPYFTTPPHFPPFFQLFKDTTNYPHSYIPSTHCAPLPLLCLLSPQVKNCSTCSMFSVYSTWQFSGTVLFIIVKELLYFIKSCKETHFYNIKIL